MNEKEGREEGGKKSEIDYDYARRNFVQCELG